jgi:hypothetical protein
LFAAGLALASTGCGRAVTPENPAPRADVIITTADSSYWITSDAKGIRMRAAALLIAKIDGRYQEIYVADDDHSYLDAVFVGQRLYRRDLLSGDSTVLFADSVVPRLAAAYAKRHPTAALLGPDEEALEHPSITATADLEVLDIVSDTTGTFLHLEYHTDQTRGDGRGEGSTQNAVRDAVLDAKTGRELPRDRWPLAFRDTTAAKERPRFENAGVTIATRPSDTPERAILSLRDATGREFAVGSITAPVQHVLWLDLTVGAAVRKALRKAFNDAAMYADDARVASLPASARARPPKLSL